MRRSAVLMTLLLSLFMFQSLWNVAAAFCGHETVSQSKGQHHFGHHVVDTSSCTTPHQQTTDHTASNGSVPVSLQDHHDHLPSCFHVVVIEAQQQLLQPIPQIQQLQPQYHWFNSYQSPDLTGHHPPPVLTPL